MTYRGHVENGVVVLDEPGALPEGATVEVLPSPLTPDQASAASDPPKGSAAAILKALEEVGPLEGTDEEWARLERMIQEDREEDLRRSIEAGEWGSLENLKLDHVHFSVDEKDQQNDARP